MPNMKMGHLSLQVTFDSEVTDLESLASAADTLMETACSTPGILDEYGNPEFGTFWPELVVAGKSPWDDDPRFPVADWQYEVASGDTRSGYLEWALNKAEQAKWEAKHGQ